MNGKAATVVHLKDLEKKHFNRGLIRHPLFNGIITRQQENDVGFYRIDVNNEWFYWIGDNPKFPRLFTPGWKEQVLEVEERVLSTGYDAAAVESSIARAAEMNEDEPPAKRPRHEPSDIQQQTYWDSPEASNLFFQRRKTRPYLRVLKGESNFLPLWSIRWSWMAPGNRWR
jgi:hypothetical protein